MSGPRHLCRGAGLCAGGADPPGHEPHGTRGRRVVRRGGDSGARNGDTTNITGGPVSGAGVAGMAGSAGAGRPGSAHIRNE